jgi:hypothetical protein
MVEKFFDLAVVDHARLFLDVLGGGRRDFEGLGRFQNGALLGLEPLLDFLATLRGDGGPVTLAVGGLATVAAGTFGGGGLAAIAIATVDDHRRAVRRIAERRNEVVVGLEAELCGQLNHGRIAFGEDVLFEFSRLRLHGGEFGEAGDDGGGSYNTHLVFGFGFEFPITRQS